MDAVGMTGQATLGDRRDETGDEAIRGRGAGAARPARLWSAAGVDEAQLAVIAAVVATAARPGDLFALIGDLGAGKTVFARAFVRARAELRGERVAEVPSPTFTLVQLYEIAGGAVWHFDLYRVEGTGELAELGWDEARSDIALVEWPDRLGSTAPEARIEVRIGFEDDPARRRVTVADRSGDGLVAAALERQIGVGDG